MALDDMPTLANERVTLRAFEDRDVTLVQSVADDPLIPLITTVPTSGSTDDALAFIARQRDRLSDGAGYSFVIASQEDDAVGQIGLWLHSIHHGRASIGYWIAPEFRRRGFTHAALDLLTNWAWSIPEIERLELYVEPWNVGSWKAAEACGFEREGLMRSWQYVGDERKDMYMYSRLRE